MARLNCHKLIREAREILEALPPDALTRADLGLLVHLWDEGERDAIDSAELRVAVLDAREELREFRRACGLSV